MVSRVMVVFAILAVRINLPFAPGAMSVRRWPDRGGFLTKGPEEPVRGLPGSMASSTCHASPENVRIEVSSLDRFQMVGHSALQRQENLC